MIVAIDGPAGTGKSTIARLVADGLGFTYVNSGSIYRAMTLRVIRNCVNTEDTEKVVACSRQANVEYKNRRLILDGVDVESDLRTSTVDANVAQLSAIPALRAIVNGWVRRITESTDAVVEGRDMTTVVFPEAEAKFYLDASVDARAKRRFDQGASDASLSDVRSNIEMRDFIDSTKSVGTLKIAPDAVYLDSSYLTIQQVYDKIYGKILQLREHHGR
jgi:cytidylate kinase